MEFMWSTECCQRFTKIKELLSIALALRLPDLTKPFSCMRSRSCSWNSYQKPWVLGTGDTLFLLTNRPCGIRMACLSTSAAAIRLLGKEGDKIALGQTMQVQVPHAVVELLEHQVAHWITEVGWRNTEPPFWIIQK